MNPWGLFVGLVFIAIGIGVAFGVDVWHYIFPLILIFIGLSIIFNHTTGYRHSHSWGSAGTPEQPLVTHENTMNYSFTFSGGDITVETNDFKGGKVSTVFGGATIDLRSAKITKNKTVTLTINATFGGAKIIVPRTWKVEGTLSGFFGGFNNDTTTPDKPEGKLFIKGSTAFGGVEVAN